MRRILASLLVAALPFGSALADAPKSTNAKVSLVYQHELPNVPGKSVKGVLVEYGPGGHSPGDTHPKSAFIGATVLEGAIRSQVNDGPVTTCKAGESFSELPGDRHAVSANASKTKPAKRLVALVVDGDETELTAPVGSRGSLTFVRRHAIGAAACKAPRLSSPLTRPAPRAATP
jgi:quercetin dioxygenase-like cupin family protein